MRLGSHLRRLPVPDLAYDELSDEQRKGLAPLLTKAGVLLNIVRRHKVFDVLRASYHGALNKPPQLSLSGEGGIAAADVTSEVPLIVAPAPPLVELDMNAEEGPAASGMAKRSRETKTMPPAQLATTERDEQMKELMRRAGVSGGDHQQEQIPGFHARWPPPHLRLRLRPRIRVPVGAAS